MKCCGSCSSMERLRQQCRCWAACAEMSPSGRAVVGTDRRRTNWKRLPRPFSEMQSQQKAEKKLPEAYKGLIPPAPSSQRHHSSLSCICIGAARPPAAPASPCTPLSASWPAVTARDKSLCSRDNGLGCINSSGSRRLVPSKPLP